MKLISISLGNHFSFIEAVYFILYYYYSLFFYYSFFLQMSLLKRWLEASQVSKNLTKRAKCNESGAISLQWSHYQRLITRPSKLRVESFSPYKFYVFTIHLLNKHNSALVTKLKTSGYNTKKKKQRKRKLHLAEHSAKEIIILLQTHKHTHTIERKSSCISLNFTDKMWNMKCHAICAW